MPAVQVPFLERVDDDTVAWVRAYGELKMFSPNECILAPMIKVGASAGGRLP